MLDRESSISTIRPTPAVERLTLMLSPSKLVLYCPYSTGLWPLKAEVYSERYQSASCTVAAFKRRFVIRFLFDCSHVFSCVLCSAFSCTYSCPSSCTFTSVVPALALSQSGRMHLCPYTADNPQSGSVGLRHTAFQTPWSLVPSCYCTALSAHVWVGQFSGYT